MEKQAVNRSSSQGCKKGMPIAGRMQCSIGRRWLLYINSPGMEPRPRRAVIGPNGDCIAWPCRLSNKASPKTRVRNH
jgi:hypothetical protein